MKIRTKLNTVSLLVLLLTALMAAALLHHAAAGRQLRALANLNGEQIETYLLLEEAPLTLLRDPEAGRADLDRASQRLSALEESFTREEEVSGRSVEADRAHHRKIAQAFEAWAAAARALLVLGPVPPEESRALAERFEREVRPNITSAYARGLQKRAAATALNEEVVSISTRIAVLAPLLCALVLGMLLWRVVAPLGNGLRELLAGARRVERGEWEAALPERGRDELTEAAAAFNRMSRAVRESQAERARLHEERNRAGEKQRELLEAAVAERTAALEDSLQQLKDAQAQLHVADRLAAVGMLASGVAHEVNNPLSFILANLHFAKEAVAAGGPGPEEREEVLRALQDGIEGSDRVRMIVQDLRVFARSDDEVASVDLREVLRSAEKMAAVELRHRAVVTEVFEANLPMVRGSSARLAQVFLNLLINAAHAIPVGKPDKNTVTLLLRSEGGRVFASVADTGGGIPAEMLPKIWDPFFTTKPVGVGTGLGLSVCHGIVRGLGGEIQVESTVGVGTRFTVILPVAEATADSPRAPVASPTPGSGAGIRRRVLVVDDEPGIGAATRRLLAGEAEVVVAHSGAEALQLLEKDCAFDLLLCDVMMPGMSGIELQQTLERTAGRPRRFAFMTGGVLTPEARSFLEDTAVQVLHKPFSVEALRSLMDERS